MPRLRLLDGLYAAGVALLLALVAAGALGLDRNGRVEPNIQLDVSPGQQVDPAGNKILLAGGGHEEVAATLHFTLPPTDAGGSGWVIWLQRDPVDAIWLDGIGPDGQLWRSDEYGFFHLGSEEAALPVGYAFALPAQWQGAVELTLHVRGDIRTALQPVLLQAQQVTRITHLGVALDAGAYAGLLMLALIVLVLYAVTHDSAFISAFACTSLGLMFMAAANGHLFHLPGFSLLEGWGSQALWALLLLFSASLLHLFLCYAGLRAGRARYLRWFRGYVYVLLALAAVCLVGLPLLRPWLQWFATLGWIGVGIGAILILFDAIRRRLSMAWWLLALVLAALGFAFAAEAMQRGQLADVFWVWYGYQSSLVLLLSVLSLSLLSRIGEYRHERDRDHLARVDSERRMRRESARAALSLALQTKLRGLDVGDIEWAAMRLLLEHLMPLVPTESTALVAYGYHGRDLVLAEPTQRKQALESELAARRLSLKRLTEGGASLQQPFAGPSGSCTEALLPIAVRAPGWGLLMLRRVGGDGFTSEEMTLAEEFLRLTVLHADEAVSSFKLRRSAELDALTGTFNRRSIDRWLGRAFRDASSRDQQLSLLFIDIDRFKGINDRIGHAGGDHCLREIAKALHGSLDGDDLLGRYGGEEFIVLLPGRGGAEARAMGERLRAAVERQDVEYGGRSERVTVSIGVSTRLDRESTPAAAIERADKALYAAKRGGRNCVHVAPAVFK